MKAMDSVSSYDKDQAAEKKKYNGFDKYEAENFADSLQRAAEVLADPKKMKAASSFIDAKKDSYKTLEKLKLLANKMGSEDE